jgi:hypothetical protein
MLEVAAGDLETGIADVAHRLAQLSLESGDADTAVWVARLLGRRAAHLHRLARRGSAVDAVVVATAEPGGPVYGGDVDDLRALAATRPA